METLDTGMVPVPGGTAGQQEVTLLITAHSLKHELLVFGIFRVSIFRPRLTVGSKTTDGGATAWRTSAACLVQPPQFGRSQGERQIS